MTYSIRLLCAAALCATLGTACSTSKTAPTTDMGTGITFDAGPDLGVLDLGPDFGGLPPVGEIGASCEIDTDCAAGGMCIPASDFPGGYCTLDCAMIDCPTGAICTPVGGGSTYCLDECDPTAATRSCRAGYGCAATMVGSVCVPGCSDDTDCSGGTLCDTTGGNGGQCYTPGASVGDPCADDSLCPAGAFCFAEAFSGWPAGMCVVMGCDAAAGTGCPDGATCLPRGRMAICVSSCAMDSDCRAGYHCADNTALAGTKACVPILPPADIGQPCSAAGGVSCAGGSCLREASTGYPGSYCAQNGCTLGAVGSGCPGDTLCVADGATNRCLDACTAEADCRDGYACTQADPADPAAGSYCKPACTLDAQCVNTGATCVTATGLCTPPPP